MGATTTTIPTWTLGDRLRKAREHAGFTQEQMADFLGLARPTVNNYEKDKRVPSATVVADWSTITDVDVGWLLGAVTARYLAPRQQARPATVDFVPAGPCFLS